MTLSRRHQRDLLGSEPTEVARQVAMTAGHEHWQINGSAPELYQRYLVPAITSLWAVDLLDRAQPSTGEAILDVACGTGVVARMAAERVALGRLVGLDFNEGMLVVAKSLPITGTPIDWLKGSALSLPFPDNSFDLVLCQLGLQFFPDRALALREMRRVLAPAGRIALSVYSAIERTPAAHAFARALDKQLGPGASTTKRAEHIFPDAEQVKALLATERFEQVDVKTVVKQITFPSVLDYVRFQLIATPMAGLVRKRTTEERDKAIASIAADTELFLGQRYLHNGCLSFPQESHVALAYHAP
jgi:ubiquinone/menaquinone biosynthesis C-methylase UbiE